MNETFYFLLLGSAFLVSAKAHGRQLRLERELQGHWKVTFGGKNHPWVEALWARERRLYWGLTALAVLVVILGSWMAGKKAWVVPLMMSGPQWSWIRFTGLLVLGSMTFGFTVTGLLSLNRLAARLKKGAPWPSPKWFRDAIRGSVAWWLFTFILSYLFILQSKAVP